MNVGFDRCGHVPRAAAAVAGRNSDILFAIDAEGYRETLYRGSEPRFPKHLAVIHIDRLEAAIETTRESDSAGCRQHREQERRSLLEGPQFPHRLHIEGRQLTDVSIVPRHFIKKPGRSARTTSSSPAFP